MDETRMRYFADKDVLHLAVSDEPDVSSIEVSPGITDELDGQGELIGLEVLNASRFLDDSILESVQGKVLSPARTNSAEEGRISDGL